MQFPAQTHSSSKGETAENSLNLYEMSCQFTCLVHTLSLKGGGCTGLLATRYRTSMLFGSGQEEGPLKLFRSISLSFLSAKHFTS